ncbi:MAG: response regulator [Clostridiales bacterium]|nr:response regulator [Clostridiales bacterium]
MKNFIELVKKHYHQLRFVVAAFFTMVVLSYYYINNIYQDYLREYGDASVVLAAEEMSDIIGGTEIALSSAAFTVQEMIGEGLPISVIEKYLEAWSISLAVGSVDFDSFHGIYGVVGDTFLSSEGISAPSGNLKETVWYKGAVEAGADSMFTVDFPSDDSFENVNTITISRVITDDSGEVAGVLAIDTDAFFITEGVSALNISGYGSGFLLNKQNRIIYHTDSTLIGKNITDMSGAILSGETDPYVTSIQNGERISGGKVKNHNNVTGAVFTRKVWNGYTVGLFVPIHDYYNGIYDMLFVTSMMGLTLILILCYFMVLLTYEKQRSDEENKSKSSFLARMSHEIRTPLNAVLGMSELILREDIPHNIYEHALNIKQSSTNLISIINDILDYSKIESGKLDIVVTRYELSSLINDVVSIIRMRLIEKPIKLVVNIDAIVPNHLFGDEVRIRQILINILSNAVKYTNEGFIALDVYGTMRETDIFDFVFDIADSGIGIKEEDMGKLFGDFVQVDKVMNKGTEGTGLGLAITRNLCRAMGGDITVKSVYGEGSIFTAKLTQTYENYTKFASVKNPSEKQVILYETRLAYAQSIAKTIKNLGVSCTIVHNQSAFYEELKRASYTYCFVSSFLYSSARNIFQKLKTESKIVLITEFGEVVTVKCDRVIQMPAHCVQIANALNDIIENTVAHAGADTDTRFIAPSVRVLIVDDIATNLKVAEGLMAPYEMQVETCNSGFEAIERVKANRYDIVFMDHMMPGMDGIEASERIRAIEDDTGYVKEMPIIALTAVAVSGVKEMFLQNGLNDFLAKPIEVAKLDAILDKWVPREKRKKFIKRKKEEKGSQIIIEGIDTKVGLAMTGGNLDTYMKVLDIFYKDCIEKMEEIKKALDSNDIYLYTTYVHAMKSASANVGALEVSELAKNLETAGKNEDVLFIKENNGEFFQRLNGIVKSLAVVLNKTEEKTEGAEEQTDDTARLTEDLTTLKNALDEMDMSTIDAMVADLENLKWSAATKSAISEISHAIIMFEYDTATELIDKLLAS